MRLGSSSASTLFLLKTTPSALRTSKRVLTPSQRTRKSSIYSPKVFHPFSLPIKMRLLFSRANGAYVYPYSCPKAHTVFRSVNMEAFKEEFGWDTNSFAPNGR